MTNFTKSIGTLRVNSKTKDRSPDLIGTVKIHRQLVTALSKEIQDSGLDTAECNIAAWQYRDKTGPLLNLQISERYEPPQRERSSETIFDFLPKARG